MFCYRHFKDGNIYKKKYKKLRNTQPIFQDRERLPAPHRRPNTERK